MLTDRLCAVFSKLAININDFLYFFFPTNTNITKQKNIFMEYREIKKIKNTGK